MTVNKYANLVLEGGGVLGIAYTGAIEVLEEKEILSGIDRLAGTSAGSIVACLLSLRYTAREIKEVVSSTDFSSFEDKKDPLRILTKYGLYEGDTFLQWMIEKITRKGFAATATFADFQKAGCRELRVFATDLNMKALKEFSYTTTPNVVVAEAIRASMSIPLFFKAWKFTNNIPDNHIYVDGGTIYNFPITTFDENGELNPQTLGLHLDNLSGAQTDDKLDYDHLSEYIEELFSTLLNAQVVDFENSSSDLKRSIRIDNLGISATNFMLTEAQQQALFDSGVKYTTNFLNQI